MKGFTLIELMIAVVIVGLIAAVGFINLTSFRDRQSVVSAASGLVAVLRDAQNRSLSQEQGLKWGVHLENPPGAVNFYDLFSGSVYSSSSIAARSTLPTGVAFSSLAPGGSTSIIFSPLTGFPNAPTTIIISAAGNGSASSTIIVNSNGEIQY